MSRLISVVFLFLLLNGNLFPQSAAKIAKHWDELLSQPEFRNAQTGIQITETETGKVIFDDDSEKLFIPASVMKLVTSAAALELLGPDYRFRTRLGYSGNIEHDTLKGNLVIVGGGDPALGSEYFRDHYFAPHFLETWARQVRAQGIKRVNGNLVLDTSLYDSEKIPPAWLWEDMGNYYGAGSSALSVYDNQIRVGFRSPAGAGMPAGIVSVFPKVDGLHFKNEVLSSDDPRDLAWVFGSPIDGSRVVRGTIPKNRKLFTVKASNPFPEKLLAEEFIAFLAREGVFVSGGVVFRKADPDFKQVYFTESPPLTDLIRIMNHESVNLFAEHLVKQIAAEKEGIGTRNAGLKRVTEFWKSNIPGNHGLFMEDGSGLSHFNAISPSFLCSLLNYMKNESPHASFFYESLPVTGKGTLHPFNPTNFPGKTVRAKSGSMTRVRSYAGYVHSANHKNYTFAIMVNHFSGSPNKVISTLEKIFSDFD